MYRSSFVSGVYLLVALSMMVTGIQPGFAEPLTEWNLSYNEGGGGIELESPDGEFRFRQLGYVQFRSDVRNPDLADQEFDFDVRRARIDWLVDIKNKYQLLVEFDGGVGTVPDPGFDDESDFALVVARIKAPIMDYTTLTAGKFVTPFSTENKISSRSIDMIERYIALNSMFLLPALDVQFGAMLDGTFGTDDSWEYYLGVFNGNGRANDNLPDNNDEKEIQLKFRNHPTDYLEWAVALDYSDEEQQTLSLSNLSFLPFSSVQVEGIRLIYGGDFYYEKGPYSLRGEGLFADFDDADAQLHGGFIQPGWFQYGDRLGGLQWLLRAEYAKLEKDGVDLAGDQITAVTLGMTWYMNGNLRFKVNAVGEDFNGPSSTELPVSSPNVAEGDFKPSLLTELQFKF